MSSSRVRPYPLEHPASPDHLGNHHRKTTSPRRNNMTLRITLAAGFLLAAAVAAGADQPNVKVVREVAGQRGGLYTGNRAPLVPSGLIKLPIGAIVPKGWLRRQLELERDGMVGHLQEISPWCKIEGSAWASPEGKGHSPWEELPYWFKGYGDLGYVLKDEAVIRSARRWIDGMLASQQADGWFGPRDLKKGEGGTFGGKLSTPDFWPVMPVLNALQSYYEASGDPRVLRCLTGYFRWQLNCRATRFMADWADVRKGDNLESVYWLYNRTGEAWLLDLAAKIHRSGADWTGRLPTEHGVNLSQGFREPAEYFLQTGRREMFDATVRNYDTVMCTYGQFPGGGFAADENCRRAASTRGRDSRPAPGSSSCTVSRCSPGFPAIPRGPTAARRSPSTLCPPRSPRTSRDSITSPRRTRCSSTGWTSRPASRTAGRCSSTAPGSSAAANIMSPTAGRTTPRNSGWRRPTTACAPRCTPLRK
jgi:hypothetical protein